MIPKIGYARAAAEDYQESGLRSLPPELIAGLRETLQCGFEPQELADRLGPLIDTIHEDTERRNRGDLR